jgi:hypothetical protein
VQGTLKYDAGNNRHRLRHLRIFIDIEAAKCFIKSKRGKRDASIAIDRCPPDRVMDFSAYLSSRAVNRCEGATSNRLSALQDG